MLESYSRPYYADQNYCTMLEVKNGVSNQRCLGHTIALEKLKHCLTC